MNPSSPELFSPQNVAAFTAIAGFALCIAGWILIWLGTRVLGLAAGAGLGFAFGEALSLVLQATPDVVLWIRIITVGIGGLLGLFVMKSAGNFVFAAIGFLFGALAGRMGVDFYATYYQTDFVWDEKSALIVFISAAVATALAFLMKKYILILATAYAGTLMLHESLAYLNERPHLTLPILILSVLWQLATVKALLSRKIRRRDDN